jgi:hypothetical protein
MSVILGKPGLGAGAVPAAANSSPNIEEGMADSAARSKVVVVPDGQVATSKAVSHHRFR